MEQVLSVCNERDKAIVLLMVDFGLRRAEVCALNWEDVDLQSGLIRVQRGKGGKARSAAIGATTREALLAYQRTVYGCPYNSPLFLGRYGTRFTGGGLALVFCRISKRVGFLTTADSLRRTFTILSLRAGMDSLHLQALGGWADMTMVSHYAQMVDEDLLEAHRAHSPIDNLARLHLQPPPPSRTSRRPSQRG